MGTKYLEAAHQQDSRSPTDLRTQPWRNWWPITSATIYKQEDPWRTWKFDCRRKFDKPWANWKMEWPSSYSLSSIIPKLESADIQLDNSTEAPQAVYDPDIIREFEEKLSFEQFSMLNRTRTNTYLQFFAPDPQCLSEKPYVSKIPPPKAGMQQINFGGKCEKVVVTDIKGHEEEFTLDKDGFEFVPNVPYHQTINSSADIANYIFEMSKWLKEHLRCGEVYVFDYALRTEIKEKRNGYVDVARRVHCGKRIDDQRTGTMS
jgi:hypothetical protein